MRVMKVVNGAVVAFVEHTITVTDYTPMAQKEIKSCVVMKWENEAASSSSSTLLCKPGNVVTGSMLFYILEYLLYVREATFCYMISLMDWKYDILQKIQYNALYHGNSKIFCWIFVCQVLWANPWNSFVGEVHCMLRVWSCFLKYTYLYFLTRRFEFSSLLKLILYREI